ncbi:glycosyltransferase family 4 protein [Candidatus Merdisoma sp. JLR.KK006]|jgi:glycosyltransferase involved in cell wall biosynthesis|uniref:glycosyltransferase family 4 protein n=1 Tax=Candidatus Merdisoma sp. JLR.KK006 TaxID=3112626 RepID=UPI002FF2B554
MKKIVFYIGSVLRPGGAERVMANLVNYFFEEKYEVLLVTDVINRENNAEYPIDKEINRIVIGEEYGNAIVKNWRRIKKLRKCMIEHNPDIVLSFMGLPNIRMLLSTIGLPCKKVVSVRNDPYKEYGKGVWRCLMNGIYSLADGYVFQTDKVGAYFTRKINLHSKVINNPVNESFFKARWQGNEKTIICVGRLEKQKNHALLLKAFAEICSSIAEYNLILYGDGALRDTLKQMSVELGIENRVIFAGEVTNVEDILTRASLFVLPSDFEGMPNALMEAMAVGIPSISTNCPIGGPEMLFSQQLSEFLVPCSDEKALAEGMLKILKLSQDRRKEISVKMKDRAKIFNPQKIYSEWQNFLESI